MSDVWYCINESDTGDWVTSIWDGLGIPAAQIPSAGESGAAYLFNDIAEQGASPTDEFSSTILTVPPAGVFTHDEYSAISFIGAADGVYTATYRGRRNGVVYGDYTVTMTIGSASTGLSPFKVWSGSAWVSAQVKRWNGSAWVDVSIRRWNGAEWV